MADSMPAASDAQHPPHDELQALSEAATPGPWGVGKRADCKCCRQIDGLPNNVEIGTVDEVDAAFTVAAVNHVRALLNAPVAGSFGGMMEVLPDDLSLREKLDHLLSEWEEGADAWGACSHEWVRLGDLRALLVDGEGDS